ncbi:hypothetical protein ABZ916_39690 [Streptomyces sp. NPDC046853]|uniref:hypothetical protein n=1 Tax=Streptomyces sp. NPDC046853 TaxID=3154920 RepID=UPI0033D86CB9
MTNVNDIVQQQIDAAKRRQQAQQQRRDELAHAREHGLAARHRTKLTRIGQTEQQAMRIALASLRRDHQGVSLALSAVPDPDARRVAAVALAAVAELALAAPPDKVQTAIDGITRMHDAGPDDPSAA